MDQVRASDGRRGASLVNAIRSTQVALLNNNKNSEYCAPLTSFDWNEI